MVMCNAAWTKRPSASVSYKEEQEDFDVLPLSCPYTMWVTSGVIIQFVEEKGSRQWNRS